MPAPSRPSKPSHRPAIRQGGVYWVRDFPPLDGGQRKHRWVVVIDDPEYLKGGGDPVSVVACSTTVREDEADRVKLPSRADTPTCRTGLTQTCWAVPRWHFRLYRHRLTDCRGQIPSARLIDIFIAYRNRLAAAGLVDPSIDD